MDASASTDSSPWLHRYAVFTASATAVLIFVGGLVTTTGSGLAVPDWPLSFGQFFPPMVGGVLFEHGHRLVAATVGLLTLVLAVWVWRRETRPTVRRLAAAAVGVVITQGALGGVTVLLKLPTIVSVTHACLGQTFFCVMVSLAVVTEPGWDRLRPGDAYGNGLLPRLCVATTATVFVQLVLGATMRHLHAGLAIPDFPLSYGALIPPSFPRLVLIHFLHRVGALVVLAVVLTTAVTILRRHAEAPRLRRSAWILISLVMLQLGLGALIIWTRRAVVPTTLHVAIGAMVLGTSVMLTLRAYRLSGPRAQAALQPALREVTA